MPVEGHARRVQTPLSRRDRRFLVLLLCLGVALVTGGLVYWLLTRSPSPSNAGCVVVTVPGTMGGATLRNCGPAAHTFCRTQGPLSEAIAAECRRQGLGSDVGGG